MRSSKSRSRSKSNRQRTVGNIVNRVFDSSGPEGKVRGTPQQIIDKYLMLARDAQLSNDRVAEQSFLQHAEHYTRMLGEAMREQAERQQQNDRQQQNQQNNHRSDNRDSDGAEDRDNRRDDSADRSDNSNSERNDRDEDRNGNNGGERNERSDRSRNRDRGDRQERENRNAQPEPSHTPAPVADNADAHGDDQTSFAHEPAAEASEQPEAMPRKTTRTRTTTRPRARKPAAPEPQDADVPGE